MAEAFVLLFVLFAIAIPLALWVAIENETSNATVVDRAEAERIARERGGRGSPGSDPDSSTGSDSDDRDPEPEWGAQSDDRWGTRTTDSARNDRPRDGRDRDDHRR